MPFFQKEEEAMKAERDHMGKCSDFNQEAIDYQRELYDKEVVRGTLYRHFKGGIYRVICEAYDESHPLDENKKNISYELADGTGPIWFRPSIEFHGLRGGVKRFERVED